MGKMRKRHLPAVIMAVLCFMCIGILAAGVKVKAADGTAHDFLPYDGTEYTSYDGTNLEKKFTMMGENFFQGLTKDDYADKMYAVFNLTSEDDPDGAVESVSFTIGHLDGQNTADGTMKVYLDGEYVYEMALTSQMSNQPIPIDTTGYVQLIVVIEGYHARYGMGNIKEVGLHDYACKITKAATVNEEGMFTYTCACGASYTVTDPKKTYCPSYLTSYQSYKFDVWTNTYADPSYFTVAGERVYRGLAKMDYSDSATANYNLTAGGNGKYNTVTFMVGHIDGSTTATGTLRVKVGNTEVETIGLTWTMIPQKVTVVTSSTDQLTIQIDGYHARYAVYDIDGDPVDTTPKEHSFVDKVTQEAAFATTGTTTHICENCGAYYTTSLDALYRNLTDTAVKVELSAYEFTYNGKARKPAVTVSYNGETLTKDKDYTLTYSNNTKAGKATVKVKGVKAAYYKGAVKVNFIIVPGKTALSSVKNTGSGKAAVTIKQNAQATGYEIQYATNSSFYYAHTVTTKKTSYTIKNLSKGYTYYVRVRAYKNVAGEKKYGEYSKGKSVKIKK